MSPGQSRARNRYSSASAAPALDVTIRSGGMKMMAGRRFPKRTGLDFAGEVTALGPGVTDADIGQRVWGFRRRRLRPPAPPPSTSPSRLPPSSRAGPCGSHPGRRAPSVGVTALRAA
ncbi:alcohol dehydrogenase catalytic domain-containing protein [Actinopolymorpha pittospori]|uniref:alcohol dehydrogenase catalytic domain-containing protein n=1 Tax=Actinopolymorpha pittospori TaxID=648752 RepID=UPI003B587804